MTSTRSPWNIPTMPLEKTLHQVLCFLGGLNGNLRPDADLDGNGASWFPTSVSTVTVPIPSVSDACPVNKVWAGGFNITNFNLKYLTDNLKLQKSKCGRRRCRQKHGVHGSRLLSRAPFLLQDRAIPASWLSIRLTAMWADVFLPFDIESFTYSDIVGVNEPQFRALNRGISLNTPMTPATTDLIQGWYGGPLTAIITPPLKVNFVPTDWNGQAAVYSSVMNDSCRACHITRATKLGLLPSPILTNGEPP